MIIPYSNLQRTEADPLPPVTGRTQVLATIYPPAYQPARKRIQAVCRCGHKGSGNQEEYKLRCRRCG